MECTCKRCSFTISTRSVAITKGGRQLGGDPCIWYIQAIRPDGGNFITCLPTLSYCYEEPACLFVCLFVCCSPGKVSTPITEVPLGQLEISDNFNVEYLLGKACRDVFQHSQVRGGVSYGRGRQGGRAAEEEGGGGAIKRREGPQRGGRGHKEEGGRHGGGVGGYLFHCSIFLYSSCPVHFKHFPSVRR